MALGLGSASSFKSVPRTTKRTLLEAATQKAIDSEPVRSLPWLTLASLTRTWAQEEVAEAAAHGQQEVVAMVKAAREQLAPTPMGPAGVLAAVAQVAVPPSNRLWNRQRRGGTTPINFPSWRRKACQEI